MVEYHCPMCGTATDVPFMFKSILLQQLFAFIWRNPNCTMKEIYDAFNEDWSTNSLRMNVSRVYEHLLNTKDCKYRLRKTLQSQLYAEGGRGHRYKIIEYKPPIEERAANGNV